MLFTVHLWLIFKTQSWHSGGLWGVHSQFLLAAICFIWPQLHRPAETASVDQCGVEKLQKRPSQGVVVRKKQKKPQTIAADRLVIDCLEDWPRFRHNEVDSFCLYLIVMGQDLNLISHIFFRFSLGQKLRYNLYSLLYISCWKTWCGRHLHMQKGG